MTKLELYNSWKSTMRSLILLGGQLMLVKKDWPIFAEMEVLKQDKKKLRTAVRFIKYIIKLFTGAPPLGDILDIIN